MAIFKSTVFKTIRKSFGTATTYQLYGQNILRDKVTEVRNPKTLPQRMQRLRYTTLVDLARVFCQATPLGYPQRPRKQSPDNQFIQLNHGAVEVSEELVVNIDYSKIIVAKGNRALPEVTVSLDTENSQLVFEWKPEDFIRHAADDDQLYAVIFEQKQKYAKVFPLGERKKTEPTNIVLPSGWNSAELSVYVFILSKDERNASDSQYVEVA